MKLFTLITNTYWKARAQIRSKELIELRKRNKELIQSRDLAKQKIGVLTTKIEELTTRNSNLEKELKKS